jgi:signal transduction histidine kinase
MTRLAGVTATVALTLVVAAVAGVTGVRLAILAGAAIVFACGHLATPAPGKCHYATRELQPVLAMLGAVVVAIAVTGGFASPMLALLPAPLLVGWTMFGPSREGVLIGALIPLLLAGIVVMPGMAIEPAGFALLASWTTLASAWLIGWRIHRLFASLRAASSSLDRVRNGVLSDAESRRRGLETISTKLAHELKNPLSAIKSLLQLELRGSPEDKSRRRLEVMYSEAERMQTILRDYLSFERPSDAMRVAELELSELMAEVEALLAGRAEAAGVVLVIRGRGGSVVADARLLKEAIVNVASNALEATPRGGSVDIRYRVGPSEISIVVRDTGAGMTREVASQIGTPYFTTRETGTGLGVVIARSAVAQHHGTLAYESAPGRGTIATIALPRGVA